MTTSEADKVANICKVKEVLNNAEPSLLNEHLDNVLQFSLDRNAEVRKTVTGFVEEVG